MHTSLNARTHDLDILCEGVKGILNFNLFLLSCIYCFLLFLLGKNYVLHCYRGHLISIWLIISDCRIAVSMNWFSFFLVYNFCWWLILWVYSQFFFFFLYSYSAPLLTIQSLWNMPEIMDTLICLRYATGCNH